MLEQLILVLKRQFLYQVDGQAMELLVKITVTANTSLES